MQALHDWEDCPQVHDTADLIPSSETVSDEELDRILGGFPGGVDAAWLGKPALG